MFKPTLIPYVEDPRKRVVVVWDLDETIAKLESHQTLYRIDFVNTIFELKSRCDIDVTNILWTRGSLAHMIDVVAGTWLSWCFDCYLWDSHSIDCESKLGKFKHPTYLNLSNLLLIDDDPENGKCWDNFIQAKSFECKFRTRPSDIIKRVDEICNTCF